LSAVSLWVSLGLTPLASCTAVKKNFNLLLKIYLFIFISLKYLIKDSVVDRHRFDANPDPYWHQHDADPHTEPTLSFTNVEKQGKNNFYSQQCQLQLFSFLNRGECVRI